MPMRIAIDIRTLYAPKTGDRSVALGLIKGLTRIAAQERLELLLIGQDPLPQGLPGLYEELRLTDLPPGTPPLQFHLSPRPTGRRWMLSAFPKACRELRADVAIVQYMGPLRSPCPFVTLIHDTVWRSMPETFPWRDRLILNTFIPPTLKRAAAVVTGTEFAAGEIRRHYPAAAGKLHVVPYAIDEAYRPVLDSAELQRVRQAHSLPDRYILSVGVLQPRKNVQGLLEAYAALPEDLRQQVRLVITGKKGWLTKNLLTVPESIADQVHFTGYIPDEDLPALYTMASCFAYPSFYEGFGLPPLEAMACGAPVIISDRASLPEVCGEAALIINPDRPDELCAAMERVLTDDALRSEMIARGRIQAARYDWVTSARGLVKVLRGLPALAD